jgi:hypothetical protein
MPENCNVDEAENQPAICTDVDTQSFLCKFSRTTSVMSALNFLKQYRYSCDVGTAKNKCVLSAFLQPQTLSCVNGHFHSSYSRVAFISISITVICDGFSGRIKELVSALASGRGVENERPFGNQGEDVKLPSKWATLPKFFVQMPNSYQKVFFTELILACFSNCNTYIYLHISCTCKFCQNISHSAYSCAKIQPFLN